MAARIAELLACPANRVCVKAKTNELMGFVGRSEGIAAFAVVLLEEQC
jgi:2-C-methyl-D-erythritol 2,4-cyclodiphosphate synthase